MKIFIVSSRGDSSSIARKLLNEGHDARMYVRNKTFRRYIEPDVPLIKSPTVDTVSSDLLLIEDSECSKFADKAKFLKRLVVGGGSVADKLMSDIDFNERSLHGCGFTLAESKTKGLLVDVGGWFDGNKYLRPHFLGFKYHRLGTGDVGPLTVCMGIVGTYLTKSRLFTDILRRTEVLMKSLKYVGYVSIEGLINNESFRAIKLNPRLQFPIVNAIGELHPTWGTFLLKLATGEAEVVAVQPDRVVVGVNVLMRGYFDHNNQDPYKLFCCTGQSAEEAKSKVYKLINKSDIDSGYYRVDIGSEFDTSMSRLKEGEWL
jgi:phosphoribosylamine-glycine ligase